MSSCRILPLSLIGFASFVSAFTSTHFQPHRGNGNSAIRQLRATEDDSLNIPVTKDIFEATTSMGSTRKAFLASIIGTTTATLSVGGASADEGFESIAARAANIAKIVEAEEAIKDQEKENEAKIADSRTVYDFSVPVAGVNVPFMDLIKQEFITTELPGENEGEVIKNTQAKVKAILVVNIKQDDPIARRNIPELISLAAKFGRNGEFVVVCSPTDQGYFEPDTSALIRLKLASEYGYGINPVTILTDKVNLLGTGAHPFWRYVEGSCRSPSGLGRIQVSESTKYTYFLTNCTR
mmetsp:Transcript_19144/g.28675  ORF Transcript_19144/g.28675 Transcript_19144/m.28675 type:complete len:295 (+) Transcript_19144:144-1028(+)